MTIQIFLQQRCLPVLSATAMLCLVACNNEKAPAAGNTSPPNVIVRAEPVETRQWSDRLEALGTARARESVTITAKVTETVSRVTFRDGQEVESGAILVELSDRAEVANLREAQSAFEEATKQLRRLDDLKSQGTIGQAQLDQQRAAREQASARVQAIRARVADRVIVAPFAGQLGLREVSPGTLVTPGTPITTLDDVSRLYVDFSIPEPFLSSVTIGDTLQAQSAAWRGEVFTGSVRSIDSRVNPITRAVTVRAEVDNEARKLKPGMLLTATLAQAPRDVLAVDELAVVQLGRQAFLFRIKTDQTVEQVPVELGARYDGEVEVVSGVQAGDLIVVEGTVKLRPGMTVDAQVDAPDAVEPEQG